MKKNLTLADLDAITKAAQSVVAENGSSYYGWINPPEVADDGTITHTTGWGDSAETRTIDGPEAIEILKKKLDGTYGERFVMSLGTVASLIVNGYSVRFVQFVEDDSAPFDAKGWTVMVIETMPIFHINPADLRLEDVADIVEILDDDSAPDVSWKGTNKVGEFAALLAGSTQPGLDLVTIAQEASK